MRAFGFLSFGHYGNVPGSHTKTAKDMLLQHIDLAVAADELGVNGAYLRVHHFARQSASPMPLLTAMAAKTERIEVGTGVIDMRHENPLTLAEEAAVLDLISDGRVALGISRGAPEPALRGYEAFGYQAPEDDPEGEQLAHEKFDLFLQAVEGKPVADGDPAVVGPGRRLALEPHSATLRDHIWWGAGSREKAEWTGRQGLNLMSSTLLTEATGEPFDELQAEQIRRFRAAARTAGHLKPLRVSVGRSIFPLVDERDHRYFGLRQDGVDQIGIIDGIRSTFGKTYTAEPGVLVEQLQRDPAVQEADTVMLMMPNQLGVPYATSILEKFAQHVAPELGWKPNWEGPVEGDPI